MEQSIRLERRFAIIDEWLLDLDISDRAVRLYAVLARYADSETHKAYPSRDTLAERLRCSTKSVDRAAQELVESGAMTKQHRHNSSIVYTLRVVQGGGHHSPGGSSRVSRGVDTGVELTRTTELEPTELEPQNYIDTKKSLNRNHRLPENWYPSERLLEMFAHKWPDVDRDFEIDQFINYWHAEGKTKADWDRAFQVWMNRAEQRGKPRQQSRKLTNAEQGAILTLQLRQKREQREALEAIEAKKRLELGL
jgi:hypothetical protein